MQNARFKTAHTAHTAHTAKHGIQPSKATLLLMFLAAVGFIGMVVFGFLMDTSLAPIREAATASSDHGFNSFTNSLAIPGFILSVYMCAYGMYSLYKVYHQLNDPRNYGNRSGRTSS